jgi:DNA-binding HxlR family transcriptional regulator
MKDTIEKPIVHDKIECKRRFLPVRDTLDVVGGKWKLPLIQALSSGPLRFKELQREVDGITARMLSKELKDLEMNQLITREVYATAPVSVEYTLTEHGRTLKPVVMALYNWGSKHREKIIKLKR